MTPLGEVGAASRDLLNLLPLSDLRPLPSDRLQAEAERSQYLPQEALDHPNGRALVIDHDVRSPSSDGVDPRLGPDRLPESLDICNLASCPQQGSREVVLASRELHGNFGCGIRYGFLPHWNLLVMHDQRVLTKFPVKLIIQPFYI